MTRTFAPQPGAARRTQRVWAHLKWEAANILRNGEQLLLTIVIPVAVLIGLGMSNVVSVPGDDDDRLGFALTGVLALAIVATAFTGLAIATGFERRYGVLRRLATTPLSRTDLLAGKAGAVLFVEAVQVVLLVGIGLALGWLPTAPMPLAVLGTTFFVLLGTTACSTLALLMAGTLRAEATLAAANLVFLTLLITSGIAIPRESLPNALANLAALSPSGALVDGFRAVLLEPGFNVNAVAGPALILVVWSALGAFAVARWFRWE